MKAFRRVCWVALLLLPVISSCSSDNDLASSAARVATEVAVDPVVIVQGENGRASVQLRTIAGEDLSFSFDDGPVLGYRIKSSNGGLVSWYPNQGNGVPAGVIVRRGDVTELNINFLTTRPTVQTAYDPVTWLSDIGPLPVGEYIFEAGLNGLERECPWGSTAFTISEMAARGP